jgi:hypothetical protein
LYERWYEEGFSPFKDYPPCFISEINLSIIIICIFVQIVDVCDDNQNEVMFARLLDEIGCEQGAKILVSVEIKRKAD